MISLGTITRLLLLFTTTVLTLPRWGAALDFTPKYSDRMIGGAMHHRLFFIDDDKRIYLSTDFQTSVQTGLGGAVFLFRDLPNAHAIIRNSPMPADAPFLGSSLDRYREAAHRLLPPRVTDVKLSGELAGAITLNNWRSYRFTFLFREGSENRQQSVTFLDISESQQIALIALGDESSFADVSDRLWIILRTWQEEASPAEDLVGESK